MMWHVHGPPGDWPGYRRGDKGNPVREGNQAPEGNPPRGTPQAEIFPPGTWVMIYRVVLGPGERAPQVPEDTQALPLEMRVKGFLLGPGKTGEEVAVRTLAGREVRGTLVEAWPAYPHSFGRPVPELLPVGEELRSMLREEGGLGGD